MSKQNGQKSSKRHHRPRKEITVRKLVTGPMPTSLPDLDECVKQILRNLPPPRANHALKYHTNPPHSPTLARGRGGDAGGGGGGGWWMSALIECVCCHVLENSPKKARALIG